MEINDKLFENIVIVGKSDDKSTIFDEIETQEAKMGENKDLYDAFEKINKVLESPSKYNEIQTVAPTIDVNNGHVKIAGVCKHDVKAGAQDLNQVDDASVIGATTENIIDTFVDDLANAIPDMTVGYEVPEDTMQKMGKKQFTILITRKG